MAISPPSDLVMDVLRAADPSEVQAAQAKLKANRAAFAATSLAESGNGFTNAIDRLDTAASRAGLGNVSHSRVKAKDIPETYQKFEATVLQSFVKSMLPAESEEIYGKGTAGEMWRGMMAEQLGTVISKNGGVGIAAQMYSDNLEKIQDKAVSNAKTDKDDRNVAMRLITDLERKTLGADVTNDGMTSEKI